MARMQGTREESMAKPTEHDRTQVDADSRIYNLGYSRGYDAALGDGRWEGEESFQAWLLAELRDLVHDARLQLRSDLTTVLNALAVVIALVQDGKPIGVHDDDDQWEETPRP